MICGNCKWFRHQGDGFGVCGLFTLDGYEEAYCPPAITKATCIVPDRLAAANRGRTRCRRCNYEMTWAAQRRQFGRLMKRGLSVQQAKEILPPCQTCVTRYLRDQQTKATR